MTFDLGGLYDKNPVAWAVPRSMRHVLTRLTGLMVVGAVWAGHGACAQESGRLLATSGVSQVEGAAGGGLAPWAVITGYDTRDQVGGNVHATYVGLGDFGAHDRGRQRRPLRST